MTLPTWLQLILWLLVIAIACGLINKYAPIDQSFKTLIMVVGVIVALLLILRFFGMV